MAQQQSGEVPLDPNLATCSMDAQDWLVGRHFGTTGDEKHFDSGLADRSDLSGFRLPESPFSDEATFTEYASRAASLAAFEAGAGSTTFETSDSTDGTGLGVSALLGLASQSQRAGGAGQERITALIGEDTGIFGGLLGEVIGGKSFREYVSRQSAQDGRSQETAEQQAQPEATPQDRPSERPQPKVPLSSVTAAGLPRRPLTKELAIYQGPRPEPARPSVPDEAFCRRMELPRSRTERTLQAQIRAARIGLTVIGVERGRWDMAEQKGEVMTKVYDALRYLLRVGEHVPPYSREAAEATVCVSEYFEAHPEHFGFEIGSNTLGFAFYLAREFLLRGYTPKSDGPTPDTIQFKTPGLSEAFDRAMAPYIAERERIAASRKQP